MDILVPECHWKLGRSDQNGGFTVGGLPPGEYWVVAIDRIAGTAGFGDWQNPEVLNTLVPSARRVQPARTSASPWSWSA